MTSTERKARGLAAKFGAQLSVSSDCIEVDLPIPGPIWSSSETASLITSRETGETTESMWRDMLNQIRDGVIDAIDTAR